MIEPIRDLLSNPIQDEVEIDKRWVKQMSRQMQAADVELTADFVTMSSTIGEVLKLQVGDVLPIELPSSVIARVDGVPVMECGFGTSNERYALRVQNMISHQDSDVKNDHD
jgi:flagellar motor switch protein FliM